MTRERSRDRPGRPLSRAGRSSFAGGAAALVLVLALNAPLPAAPSPGTPRIAVVEFANASTDKELEALGKGLQSMIATDLAQVPGLRLVERDRLQEILTEQKLGHGGQIDKATAARLGKLAGATHLLGGTFTVVGGRMRIDARLFAVESGDVLVAEHMEGERDAFFELEKKLGQKVIDSLGITLKPRERAAVAKVQTADFDAFRSYSQGLAAFDDKRYQDAVTSLSDATRRDKDFQLAARTLEDYQRIIADLRQKAQALDSAADGEAERRARAEQAKQSAKWGPTIEQLWKLAGTPGGGQAQADRIAATLLLAKGYRYRFQLRWPRGDQFALDRTADDLDRRYVAEAGPLFPRIPPIPMDRMWDTPAKDQSVVDWVRATWAELENVMVGKRRQAVVEDLGREINDCQNPDTAHDSLVLAMLLDGRQLLRFTERLYQWREALEDSPRGKTWDRVFRASLYRDQLELERSTALLAEQSRADAQDAHAMRRDAAELETNRRLLELLQTSKSPHLAREVLLREGINGESLVQKLFITSSPGPEAYHYLLDDRRLSHGYLFVGDVPVWLIHSGKEAEITSGPRTDRRRTAEVRYWPDVFERKFTPGGPPGMMLLAEGKPRSDLRGRFTVRFTMPEDFRLGVSDHLASARSNHVEGAYDVPEVGFAFGIRQARGDDKLPTTGFVVILDHRTARLARFVIGKPDASADAAEKRRNPLGGKDILTTVIEEHPLALPKGQLEIGVLLKGATLELTAGGRKVSFHAPAERNGFEGIMFRDLGYASVSDLSFVAP